MFERIWEGCEDIEDDPKSGQPSTVRNTKQFQKLLHCWQEIAEWPSKWWKISCTLTGRCFNRFIMKVWERGISAPSYNHTQSDGWAKRAESRTIWRLHSNLSDQSMLSQSCRYWRGVLGLSVQFWNKEHGVVNKIITKAQSCLLAKVEYYQNDDNHFLINGVCWTKNLCLKKKQLLVCTCIRQVSAADFESSLQFWVKCSWFILCDNASVHCAMILKGFLANFVMVVYLILWQLTFRSII